MGEVKKRDECWSIKDYIFKQLNPALPDVKGLIKFICCKQISVITDLEKSQGIP